MRTPTFIFTHILPVILCSFIFSSCQSSLISETPSTVPPESSNPSATPPPQEDSSSGSEFHYVDGFFYWISDTGTLRGMCNLSGEPLSGKVIIPSSVDGICITAIDPYIVAFHDSALITEVIFPDTITELPKNIFKGCSGLKKVILPCNISEIPENAFLDCVNLTEVNLPNGIYKICKNAFASCISLKSIALPPNVEMLESGAFQRCENLHTVYLPKSIQKIGVVALPYQYSLSKVYFEGSRKEWDAIEFPKNSTIKENLEKILILMAP